jgi:hypothetical protein
MTRVKLLLCLCYYYYYVILRYYVILCLLLLRSPQRDTFESNMLTIVMLTGRLKIVFY